MDINELEIIEIEKTPPRASALGLKVLASVNVAH